ncbi:MAG: chloride channel protein [Hyphomicrobiaceae bacterium]
MSDREAGTPDTSGGAPVVGSKRPAAVSLGSTGQATGPVAWLRELLRSRFIPNVGDFLADRQPLVWLLALAIGIAVAYAALLFRLLIGFVQVFWLGTTSERVYSAAMTLPWWWIIAGPTIGGLIVGLVLDRWVSGRRAHAVADVIEARAIRDCRIPVGVGLWSALVSAISLGSGASAGREGPVVHLGATLASAVEDLFRLSPGSRRTLLACGVAAAVSASFNAPLAGVLFAHEVILAHYAVRAFVPVVISSVAGAVIARLHFGNFPAFSVPGYQITSYLEFPAFALLGLTCAVVAIMFEFALMAGNRLAMRTPVPFWLKPTAGGFMVGLIALAFPQVLGVGYDATDMALKQQFPLMLLLALIVAKTVATSITLGCRFGGGVFSPSLYLGAMTGCAYGIIATSLFPEMASSQGLYALLGMGGVASAVLGAPISTMLIIFELTGGYEMSLALLLTISISNGLTQAVHGSSYFHWQLSSRGLSLQEGPHKEIMRKLCVRDFFVPLEPGQHAPPIDADDGTPWLLPGDTVEQALRTFDRSGLARVAVVSELDSRIVVGWADRVEALSVFNKALIDAHVEEHR